MKKILTVVFVFLMLLSISSCKKEETNISIPEEQTQEVVEKQEETAEEIVQEETKEEVKEETNQETKEEIDPEVLKTYKYWVVFYNPDGTELQREALKWGTTPEFYDGTPYYYDGSYDYDFVGWTNRKGKPKELKPITGNTYFYAKYEISTGRKSSGGGSNPPAPDPEYIQVICLTHSYGSYINTQVKASENTKFIYDAKLNTSNWNCIAGSSYNYNVGGVCVHSLDNIRYQNASYEIYMGNHVVYPTSRNEFGERYTYEYQVKSGDSYFKANGNTIYSDSQSVTLDSRTLLPMYLFAENVNGSVTQGDRFAPFSIYYFQIYQNGALVRDYIPVKTIKEIDGTKNATSPGASIPIDTLCMYDKANDMYYLNLGSTPFTDVPVN